MAEQDYFDQLSRVVSQLTAAINSVNLYPPTHPQVAPYIDKSYTSLTEIMEERPDVTLLLIDDALVANNRQLSFAGAYGQAFVKILQKKGVERITFLTGLPRSHLERLIMDLASPDPKTLRSTSCIKLGRVEIGETGEGKDEGPRKKSLDEEVDEFLEFRERELRHMHDLYESVQQGQRMEIQIVQAIVGEFTLRFRREMNPLSLLATIKSHDEYTFVHVTNVGLLVMCQAEALGFTGAHLHDIGIAALLHDVGKLIIPQSIVAKPAALTNEERMTMEQHTTLGAQYLINQKEIPRLALLAALEHHIKYDGAGYPAIPGKWRPHIVSQMISVADVFDAMRSRRPYRDAMPIDEIKKIMRAGMGSTFNPMLVEFFLQLIER